MLGFDPHRRECAALTFERSSGFGCGDRRTRGREQGHSRIPRPRLWPPRPQYLPSQTPTVPARKPSIATPGPRSIRAAIPSRTRCWLLSSLAFCNSEPYSQAAPDYGGETPSPCRTAAPDPTAAGANEPTLGAVRLLVQVPGYDGIEGGCTCIFPVHRLSPSCQGLCELKVPIDLDRVGSRGTFRRGGCGKMMGTVLNE